MTDRIVALLGRSPTWPATDMPTQRPFLSGDTTNDGHQNGVANSGRVAVVRVASANIGVLDSVADDVFGDDIDTDLLRSSVDAGQLIVVADP